MKRKCVRIRLSALKVKSEAITNASVKAEERKLKIEDRQVQFDKERYRVGNTESDSEITTPGKVLTAIYGEIDLRFENVGMEITKDLYEKRYYLSQN